MRYDVDTIDAYMNAIPKDRAEGINQLRETIKNNLPEGFKETFLYSMITYTIPLETYPKGYHVTPDTPLTLMAIASQKQTTNVYHFPMYHNIEISNWFHESYKKLFNRKPNMGKSCIRFKTIDDNVLKIIGELSQKVTVHQYIETYENRLKK